MGVKRGQAKGCIEYFLAGLVAAATFLVYLRTLRNGFVNWDDGRYVYDNTHIHSFNAAFLKWASGFYFANWHPLTLVSYAMDYAIWGADPVGYHLTNIILHSANVFIFTVLVMELISAWEETAVGRQAPTESAFLLNKFKLIAGVTAGLLFGLHPLHVESVAWVAERKDVLCGLFFLLSILAYLKYAGLRGAPSMETGFFERWYLLSLLFFALSLMSKTMAVSLPLVLLILDWHPFGRIGSFRSFSAAFIEKIPFIILSGGASVLTVLAQGGAIQPFNFAPLHVRVLVAARSLVLYLWKMVLPINLVPYYPYPKNVSFLSPGYFLPAALVVAVTVFCLFKAKRQRKRIWLACWGYFAITLLPVIGIVQVGGQAMADRYTYLPGLGPFLLSGVGAAWGWQKAGALKRGRAMKTAAVSAALLAVLSISCLTFRQIGIWKNSIVLWDYVIRKEPNKIPTAYFNQGTAFEKIGRMGSAISDYDKAIAINPAGFKAYYNLGGALERTGRPELAIAEYDKLIALKPSLAIAYNDRGVAYLAVGQTGMAIADYDRAATLDPSDFRPYANLGLAFEKMGRMGTALGDYNKAILLKQDDPELYFHRGKVYFAAGIRGLAALDFRRACGLGNREGCEALQKLNMKGWLSAGKGTALWGAAQ